MRYGFAKHNFSIIHILPIDISQNILDSYEKLYIECYKDCNCLMLNLTDGGRGCKGLKLSESTKKYMSKIKSKPITQFDLEGKIIEHWESTNIAADSLNITPQKITANIKRRTKSCNGFIFKTGIINENLSITDNYSVLQIKNSKTTIWRYKKEMELYLKENFGDIYYMKGNKKYEILKFYWTKC